MTPESNHVEKLIKRELAPGTRALWEREWQTFENFVKWNNLSFPQRGTVLDAGCGLRGLEAGALARGFSYIGLDIDDADFETDELPLESGSVNVAFSLATLEHLSRPEKFVSEINRVLVPGGLFFATVPNIKFAKESFWDNPGHVKPFTSKSLQQFVGLFGFEVRAVYPGMRGKPRWMYEMPAPFSFAARMPIRRNFVRGPLVAISGRANSVALVAVKI